jgi:acetoin utilization protein AcuA
MMVTCDNYRPIISKKESLTEVALNRDANVTLAFSEERQIVGLGLLQYACAEDRWSRVGESMMMEISALEVSRPWRNAGVGKEILNLLLDHPLKEDRIFFMVGYSWTWDLKGTGMRASDYRKKMLKLFATDGFRTYKTNEPNIMLRPENLFMARIGENVSDSIRKKFYQVRFDIDRYVE